jgi:carboxylate-amine ligase
MDEQFTIGIEEEFQIVDPVTRELRSHITQMLEEGRMVLQERIKPEMHQSVVEVGTGICQNIKEARKDVTNLRRSISQLASKAGLKFISAGTHPFSDWKAQPITEHDRYKIIVEDMQDVARANLIFGLHVHIGIKDKETQIGIFNQIRYFLPHLLALSTSSPFWLGRKTGLKSTRSSIFKRFPRTDIPVTFGSWNEFEDYINILIKTGCIDNGKKIWWDVRPHALYDTIEVRICDIPTRVDETIALAALIQALAYKLYKLYKNNMSWRLYSAALIAENKWRAMRYGIDGKLIDFGKKSEVPMKELAVELIDFVSDAAGELGSKEEISYIRKIIEDGTSADRQCKVYEQSGGDIKAVVDYLIEDTMRGI